MSESPPTMQLTITAEHEALSSASAQRSTAMVSMACPEAPTRDRQPLELIAVVDRSGSMRGQKIEMMKSTLKFLLTHGLQQGDKFGIVAFDNKVETRLALTEIKGENKQAALAAVNKLQTGGSTNLSGGLLQGIDLLQRHSSQGAGITRAVLLFTDGNANNGITEPAAILSAAEGAMGSMPCTVFTFGFGADHQEDLLRGVAEQTNGLYYFIDSAEAIPQAFADCLGGLVSVLAQNVSVTLAASSAAEIGTIESRYKSTTNAEHSTVELQLGDLYAEDEKDIVLNLKLPALPSPHPEPLAALSCTLRYFSVPNSKIEEVTATLHLRRPAVTPASQPINLKLDEQRNRVEVARALEEASALADRGRLEEGRQRLQQAISDVQLTPSINTPSVQAIMADVERVAEGYNDMHTYMSSGSKACKMSAMSHHQQRSNNMTGLLYEKKSKRMMKSSAASFASTPSTDASGVSASRSVSSPPFSNQSMPFPPPLPAQQAAQFAQPAVGLSQIPEATFSQPALSKPPSPPAPPMSLLSRAHSKLSEALGKSKTK